MTINSLVPRLVLFPFEIPKLHLITVLIFSDQAKRRCILYALGGKLRRVTFAPNFWPKSWIASFLGRVVLQLGLVSLAIKRHQLFTSLLLLLWICILMLLRWMGLGDAMMHDKPFVAFDKAVAYLWISLSRFFLRDLSLNDFLWLRVGLINSSVILKKATNLWNFDGFWRLSVAWLRVVFSDFRRLTIIPPLPKSLKQHRSWILCQTLCTCVWLIQKCLKVIGRGLIVPGWDQWARIAPLICRYFFFVWTFNRFLSKCLRRVVVRPILVSLYGLQVSLAGNHSLNLN